MRGFWVNLHPKHGKDEGRNMSNLQRRTNACYGIECWLRKQGLKATKKSVSDLTANFLRSKGLPYSKFNPRYKGLFYAAINNAEAIQEHFSEFKSYVLNLDKTLNPTKD